MAQENTDARMAPEGASGSDHPEIAASGLMVLSCLFLLAGVGLFTLMLIKLAIPTLFADTAFLSYGRLRPAAVSMLVYGFGGTLAQAAAYYLTPRLVGVPLRNQPVALLAGAAYGGLVLIGALVVLFRGPSGPELAEFPPLVDWPLAAVLLVPPMIVTSMIRDRTDEGTYISLLYVIGAVWWFPALHITGSIPGLGNIGSFLQTSLVAGGMLTLALPAAALGAAYYVAVKESGRPLFSGPLARAGFWTLAGTALLATPARFLGGPAPGWTETIAVAASMGLALSALTVMSTVGLTLSGDWETTRSNIVLRTLFAGTVTYSLITLLMGVSGFRSVAAVVGLTTWYDGLATGLMIVADSAAGGGLHLLRLPQDHRAGTLRNRPGRPGPPAHALGRWRGGRFVARHRPRHRPHLELGQRVGSPIEHRRRVLLDAGRPRRAVHARRAGLRRRAGGSGPLDLDRDRNLRRGTGPGCGDPDTGHDLRPSGDRR